MSELYKYLKLLREKRCVSQKEVAEELGISPASYNLYEKGKREPSIEMIEKIADYFNVSPSYLTGWDNKTQQLSNNSSEKDEKDIKKDLDRIMNQLSNQEYGPAAYDGQDLSPEAAELFREELEIALKRLKIINKEKYTPKKYKKD